MDWEQPTNFASDEMVTSIDHIAHQTPLVSAEEVSPPVAKISKFGDAITEFGAFSDFSVSRGKIADSQVVESPEKGGETPSIAMRAAKVNLLDSRRKSDLPLKLLNKLELSCRRSHQSVLKPPLEKKEPLKPAKQLLETYRAKKAEPTVRRSQKDCANSAKPQAKQPEKSAKNNGTLVHRRKDSAGEARTKRLDSGQVKSHFKEKASHKPLNLEDQLAKIFRQLETLSSEVSALRAETKLGVRDGGERSEFFASPINFHLGEEEPISLEINHHPHGNKENSFQFN